MEKFRKKYGFSEDEWNACLHVLSILKDQPLNNPDNQKFGTLLKKISKNAKKQLSNHEAVKADTIAIMKKSTIAKNAILNKTYYGEESDLEIPTLIKTKIAKNCYACNSQYHQIHSFYHRLCPDCAKLNFTNRSLKVDLSNRNVILTGGRIKVGYASALKILRCNANLTITTRFPAIAFENFQKEKDFEKWKDRLNIYGLDLRRIKDVEQFINDYSDKNNSLDILINNAAQTIQYDQHYYAKIQNQENNLIAKNKELNRNKASIQNLIEYPKDQLIPFEENDLNRFGQPIDQRLKNSWNSKLEEIDIIELLEVNLINQISPYILIKGLLPILKKSSFENKFIINVTSSEGQFSYENKTRFHPHTNMTKAALNMLTHTSAKDYAQNKIFLNCVDVGWISTGAIEPLRKKQFEAGYIPPLDPVDGAARILHPIYEQLKNKKTIFGKLLKNYRITDW